MEKIFFMRNRKDTVDLFKFISSILIIGIHTNLFVDINDTLNFAFVDIVCRLAVPFFAVCSGYFLSKSLAKNEYGAKPIKKQEWKLIKLYALWTVLYLAYSIPTWIKSGWMSFGAFKDYALATVTQGCHYHLWYLISLIYALPLFYLCVRFIKNRKLLFVIMILLYIIKALSYGYARWLPTFMQTILGIGGKFSALFDAVFLLLPLLLLGFFISQKKISLKLSLIGFIVSFSLLTVEAFTLKAFGQESVSFIFMTLPTAYFLFSLISQMNWNLNGKVCTLLGAASLVIYCFHPMIVGLFFDIVPSSILLFVITTIISAAVALMFVIIRTKISSRKQR